jgi:hypothetical protein
MKHLRLYTLLIFSAFIISCNNEDSEPPNLISEQEMAKILVDIHVIEARVNKMALSNLDTSTLVNERLKLSLFKEYKTDSLTFNRSYQFYSTHPDYLERIYEDVTKQLQVREKKKNYKHLANK